MRPTISLCIIARDEGENLARCLDSVAQYVDEIIVVDTGSVDDTRAVATRYGASVYQFDINNHPESFFVDDEETCKVFDGPAPYSGMVALGDFAAARNESFRHAKCDFVFWIDSDDVLEGGSELRAVVQDMQDRKLDMAFLPYDYAKDHLGRVFYRQWRERIFRRGLGTWVNPVHEVYIPHKPNPPMARYDLPKTSHCRKADRKSVPHRNYKNLLRQAWQTQLAGGEPDPRMLFYLGQEARFVDPRRAVSYYAEYLRRSGWPEERAAAHVAIGSLLELGTLGLPMDEVCEKANREFATAAAEMPDNPDGVFGMARIAYMRGRWQDCVTYTERGLKIGNTDSMLGANPMDRVYRPHVYYNHALAQLGRLEEAIQSCKAGLEIAPDDPGVPNGAPGMLKHNLQVYEQELERRRSATPNPTPSDDGKPMLLLDKNEALDTPPANVPRDAMVIWALQLWKRNLADGDRDRAARLIDALPVSLHLDPVISRMRDATFKQQPTQVPVEDVVFYLGPGVEPWDPTTPNKQGLGGSETAAIEMARNLALLGRKVTVYAEADGLWDGVRYIPHSQFKGTKCSVFIASRTPWSVVQFGPVIADVKLLWVHDIHCGPQSPQMEHWLYQFDRILCLSNWHKEFFCSTYKTVDPDCVVVTRNGIDPARFADPLPKENRLVFSSSPNRGLPALLHNLREIRKQVPDATVDIYYGFETWETMMRMQGNQEQLNEIERYKQLISEAERDGLARFHGRRPQTELAQAFLRAKVWGYPTEFPETSCISAMEAMAAGAVPVCTRFAALAETVKVGIQIDPSPVFGREFVERVVEMLTNESLRSELADAGRKWALENLSWRAVAESWLTLFESVPKELRARPIPAWREVA